MLSRLRWFTHFEGRKLEYVTAVHAAASGAFLLMPFDALRGSAGAKAMAGMMPEAWWGGMFLTLGAVCAWSLHINGRAWWTPFARLVSLFLLMVAWAAAAGAFITYAPHSLGTLNMVSLAFWFCGNGLLAASRDAGREFARWRGREP